jgi:hypothetical protein
MDPRQPGGVVAAPTASAVRLRSDQVVIRPDHVAPAASTTGKERDHHIESLCRCVGLPPGQRTERESGPQPWRWSDRWLDGTSCRPSPRSHGSPPSPGQRAPPGHHLRWAPM